MVVKSSEFSRVTGGVGGLAHKDVIVTRVGQKSVHFAASVARCGHTGVAGALSSGCLAPGRSPFLVEWEVGGSNPSWLDVGRSDWRRDQHAGVRPG